MTGSVPIGLWGRSLLFTLWFYLSLAAMGLVFAPAAAMSRDAAYWAMKAYCRQIFWVLERLCGVRVEVRGAIPQGEAIIASKHHSFLDVMMMMRFAPRPKFVMKRSLIWTPIVGLYALRIGAAPIDREAGGRAVRDMERRLGAERGEAGQVVIYPEGTRTPPGARLRYRRGVARLARRFQTPCVPAATNAGLFWPKSGLLRHPGVAVVAFLEPLAAPDAAREDAAFMARLEQRIEDASARLLDALVSLRNASAP